MSWDSSRTQNVPDSVEWVSQHSLSISLRPKLRTDPYSVSSSQVIPPPEGRKRVTALTNTRSSIEPATSVHTSVPVRVSGARVTVPSGRMWLSPARTYTSSCSIPGRGGEKKYWS